MAREMKIVVIPQQEQVTYIYKCRCGNDCGTSEPKGNKVDRATIQMETGHSFGYTAGVQITVYDICTECFEKYVVPAMEVLGFEARNEDGGY